MPIITKKVRNTKYVYFRYWDKAKAKMIDVYCGSTDDSASLEKAKALERDSIKDEIISLENHLRETDTAPKPVRKRKRSTMPRSAPVADVLKYQRDTKVYEPRIYYKSSQKMTEVEDNSVQLIVTSPPYNVGIDYGAYDDNKDFLEYMTSLNSVWTECVRVLCEGGRIAVNVADTGRQPFIPVHTYVIRQFLALGLKMRGVIYWNKAKYKGQSVMQTVLSTAWGSWRSASNPFLRDTGEFIVVFCKDTYKLKSENRITTITPNEFTAYTQSVWNFPATTPESEGHPAPFPDELPKRLIQLYSFLGDTVLDPFLGSGTTCKVAKAWGRKSIGYEIDEQYRPVIERKIASVESLAIPLEAYAVNGKPPIDNFAVTPPK